MVASKKMCRINLIDRSDARSAELVFICTYDATTVIKSLKETKEELFVINVSTDGWMNIIQIVI